MDIAQASNSIQVTQQASGAWGHRSGIPSTELTALCLLALRACSADSGRIGRGGEWLRSIQRSDGGWPPYPNVEQSTWLTALAMLALGHDAEGFDQRATSWLVDRTGRESTFFFRLRATLLGGTQLVADGVAGWPWYPDTAAWVTPTSFSILALAAKQRRAAESNLGERIQQGRSYLLARVCHDGGWNHGSSRALGYDSDSYPETTGLALTALHGFESSEVSAGIAAAKSHLGRCHSLNGLAWLTLGLLSQGESVPPDVLGRAPCRDTSDMAMYLLAAAALEGKNLFLA